MISVVVFYYSDELQSMLLDYEVTYMGCFYDYLYTLQRAKTTRGIGIIIILLNVSQCITFNQKTIVT